MSATISIALPPTLRDLIAHAAAAHTVTQDRMAALLLDQQLAAISAPASAELAAQILGHPRLTSAWPNPATLNIDRASNDRAAALAAQLGTISGHKLPKGRVIQALLWQAVEPVDAAARRALPSPPPPRSWVTVSVPAALNTTLLDWATARDIARETVIAELLDSSLEALAADTTTTRAALTAWPTAPSTTTTSTVHLPRAYDTPLQVVADQLFAGVKSRAIQALLGYALQHHAEPTDPLPDRPVPISGALYARMARLTHAERAARGDNAAIRAFVEAVVEKEVTRVEARQRKVS